MNHWTTYADRYLKNTISLSGQSRLYAFLEVLDY